VKNYRTILLKHDGTELSVETTANIMLDKDGNYNGVEGIVRDITDRKIAEQALKESEASLRELNATKDKLFSVIAHDLKSPFTCILGFSELLTDNLATFTLNETEEYIGHIHNSAKNTLALLENLLSWSKTLTGQMVFKPENVNLNRVAQEIMDVLSLQAKIKNITLINSLQTDNEIRADQNMLQSILRNLFTNAIKFTGNAGKIEIMASKFDGGIQIAVSDTGIGMDDESQSKLFKIDQNITKRGTANEKGSGLGLLICKEFVEKHGGSIWAESELGKGSVFKFTLPLK
jgi:signal transduction histidine kinase